MSAKTINMDTFVLVTQNNKASILKNFGCFLCNHFIANNEVSWMLFEKYLLDDNNSIENSLSTILSAALGHNLKEHKTHSSLLCNKCKNLILEFENIEQKLAEIRYQILITYNRTAKLYNLKSIPIEINGVLQNTENDDIFNDNNDHVIEDNLIDDDHDDDIIDVNDDLINNDLIILKENEEQQKLLSSQSGFITTDDIEEISLVKVATDDFDDNEIKVNNFYMDTNETSTDNFVISFKEESILTVNDEHENQNNLLVYDESITTEYFAIDDNDDNNAQQQEHTEEAQNIKKYIKIIENEDVSNENDVTQKSTITKNAESTVKKRISHKDVEAPQFEIINGNYVCLICTNHFSYDCKSFMEHMRKVHNLRFYFCVACSLVFKRRLELTLHIEEQHKDGNQLNCDICQRAFVNYRFFQMHKRMHITIKDFKCNYCNKSYNSKNQLEEHLKTHDIQRSHQCQKCEKNFASKYTLQTHLKIHTQRERQFQCEICNKTFFNQQSLQNHRWGHEGVKSFLCEDCGKSFTTSNNLDIHMVVHTGQRAFSCSVCEKTFARRAEVKDHERTHTGERPFKCDICEASFAQRANLMSHRKSTHFNEKLHKCEQCGRSFKRRRLLNYHINAAHTGVRPYKCDICESTFVYPEHYKKHLILHSGRKPYACEVCGKKFNSRDNRNAHRFVHSHKKPYECLECGAGFMRKPMLLAHMKHTNHQNDAIIINQPQLPIPQVMIEDTETLEQVDVGVVNEETMENLIENRNIYDNSTTNVNVQYDDDDNHDENDDDDNVDDNNDEEDCNVEIGEGEVDENDDELMVPVVQIDMGEKYIKFADLDDETLDW